MRVDGDVVNFAVGIGDVVVERADFVLETKLLADVFTASITEDADGLFDWPVGGPHHGCWLTVFFCDQLAKTTLWGDDPVVSGVECLIVGADKRSGGLFIHVI